MSSTSTPTKQYKTLPGPLRREERRKHHGEHSHSPLFGLNLNLSFSNLISSGVNFFDNLRKKTPGTPHSSATDSSSPSSVSGSGTTSLCEAIEMQPMVPVFADPELGTGQGHEWVEIGSHNPAWCDLCGELIWGLYDTGAWQCCLCGYTAHLKCRDSIRLDCMETKKLDLGILEPDLFVDEDDTDGNIQSLPSDDEEELSFSSYTTAKAEQLSQLTSGAPHPSLVSQTSDTLVPDDQDQFHTLQDVEDLTPDTVNIPSLLSIPPDTLTQYILNYNASMPVGQGTAWCPEKNYYSGYIRVEMNLTRPINVISGTRPPSIYNIISEDTINDRTLTTFYLPPGTEKALHITSHTTTQDVVRVLLKKFRVADNPHKYALYERNMDDIRRDSFPKSKSLSRLKLRRLNEDEKPLMLAVLWMKDPENNKKFVLQENDPGEIQWEQFSLPELKNFLLILDREEAWYKRRIHEKYETVQQTIHELLQEKRPDQEKFKGKEYVY